jgi:hypothetical protein
MDTGTVTIKVLEQDDVVKLQSKEREKKNKLDMSAARRVYQQMNKGG